MGRSILIISILLVLMVIIITFVSVQNKLVPPKMQMINSTNREDLINTNPINEHPDRSTTLDSNENIGRIASLPPKCLGSALCPD